MNARPMEIPRILAPIPSTVSLKLPRVANIPGVFAPDVIGFQGPPTVPVPTGDARSKGQGR
jgi:hypothetical protein